MKMDFASVGNVTNFVSIVLTIVLTLMGMLQWPSTDTFDAWWIVSGFCVSGRPDRWIDTELLCSIFLILSASIAFNFANSKQDVLRDYPQLKAKISGGVFANFAHGAGHLFLYLLALPTPKMSFIWSFEGIGNAIMTLFFFTGVFRAILVSFSLRNSFILATLAIVAQYLLDVPEGLVFTYSQAVILFAGSVDQMLLSEKGITYVIVAASYIPLLGLYALEMTHCSGTLAFLGGHAVYDLYLSLLPFALFYAVQTFKDGPSCHKELKFD